MKTPAMKMDGTPLPKPEPKLVRMIKLPTSVLGMDITPDGKTVYTACLDGGVYGVDSATGARRKLGQHDSYASSVALLGGTGRVV